MELLPSTVALLVISEDPFINGFEITSSRFFDHVISHILDKCSYRNKDGDFVVQRHVFDKAYQYLVGNCKININNDAKEDKSNST